MTTLNAEVIDAMMWRAGQTRNWAWDNKWPANVREFFDADVPAIFAELVYLQAELAEAHRGIVRTSEDLTNLIRIVREGGGEHLVSQWLDAQPDPWSDAPADVPTASEPLIMREVEMLGSFPAAPNACCDLHSQHCEPPSELCCENCTECAHDTFPLRHADGSTCVLDVPAESGAPR